MDRSIALWMLDSAPVRAIWRSRRYRVTDTPTALRPEDIWHPAMTHPPRASWVGWRLQAVDGDGAAVAFDVRPGDAAGEWVVLAVRDYARDLAR